MSALTLLVAALAVQVPAYADPGDCTAPQTDFGFSPASVKFGEGATLSWTVLPAPSCGDGFFHYELIGPAYQTYDAFVGSAGTMTVPANMLGFGDNEWSLQISAWDGQGNYVPWEIAPATVTVGMPDKLTDGSQVTITDNSVASRVTFVQAAITPHAVVHIAGNVNLDLSNLEGIPVAAGVQIIGDRSVVPVGPRLFTRTVPASLLDVGYASDDVRITGIRLEGGETDDPFSGVGPRDSDGVRVDSSQHVEIDHNEIYHWRGSGVNVRDGNGDDHPDYVGRLNRDTVDDPTNAHNVWVHDNYFHHNQHPAAENCIDGSGHAGGYGVQASYGGYVKIERNVFDWNRHAIAGDGRNGTGYVARDNLILQNGGVHFKCVDQNIAAWVFVLNPFAGQVYVAAQMLDGNHIYHTHAIDMHGTSSDCGAFTGDHQCGPAGEFMDVSYNTILYTAGNGIHLRGYPAVGMFVYGNVFAHSVHDGSFFTPGAMVQNFAGLYDQGNTLGVNAFNDRKSCDFDGDGVNDSFMATGIGWWFQSTRLAGRWVFVARSTARLDAVSVGDLNGDGLCDLTANGQTTYTNPDVTIGPSVWTQVPLLVGTSDAVAKNGIHAAGLTVGTVSYTPSPLALGTVLDQSQHTNYIRAKGTPVNLVEALGQTTVPNVVGMDAASAENALEQARLTPQRGPDTPVTNPDQNGIVIFQHTAAGTTVSNFASVGYVVGSTGPKDCIITCPN